MAGQLPGRPLRGNEGGTTRREGSPDTAEGAAQANSFLATECEYVEKVDNGDSTVSIFPFHS